MKYKEFLIFFGILVIALFMTIHNNNLKVINNRTLQSEQFRLDQENNLIEDGVFIRLSNGVTLKKNVDLIIIEQANKTIIINSSDKEQIIAFLDN